MAGTFVAATNTSRTSAGALTPALPTGWTVRRPAFPDRCHQLRHERYGQYPNRLHLDPVNDME